MKSVSKSAEVATTKLIIRTRYGHLDVLSKDEPAICSLTVVAKHLNLELSEVRRLYRKYFKKQKHHKILEPAQL